METNEGLRFVHKPIVAAGGYTPVADLLAVEGEVKSGRYIKKTITNKLGKKRTVFVRPEELKKEM